MPNDIRLAGLLGTYYCEATTAHTGKKFSMLYMNEDTVFSALTITSKDPSVPVSNGLASQNIAGGRTIRQSGLLTAPQDSYFSALTLTSGSVIGIISEA